MVWHVGHEYYFPAAKFGIGLQHHLNQTSIWNKVSLGGQCPAELLASCFVFFTSEQLRPRSDLSSWKKGLNSLCKKVSTQKLMLLLPAESSVLQNRACCAVTAVVEKGGLISAGLLWPQESLRAGNRQLCFVFIGNGENWFCLDTHHATKGLRNFPAKLHWRPRGKKSLVNQCVKFATMMEAVPGKGSTAGSCFETDFYGCQLICLWANLAHVTSSRMKEWPIIGSRLWPIVGN